MAVNQQLAQAMARYTLPVQQQMRRSQYLTDALEAMAAPQENIRSPWELAARLAGVALTNRGANKAQDKTAALLRGEKEARLARIMAGLPRNEPTAAAVLPQPAAPPVAAPPPPQPAVQAPPQVAPVAAMAPQPNPASFRASPEDRDALIRMLATEALGEGPQGMAAAGHVALNRLKSGKFGGSLRDVVYARNQFEGMSRAGQVKPEEYEAAAQVADAILSGQASDPTGGAVNFINPDLQVQLGRKIPAWAQGQGQRIGRHVFFGGQPDGAQMAAAETQPPFDVSQVSAGANPFEPPSVPGSSPPVTGAPPAAPPQAAAGGNPVMYQPTPDEVNYVRQLLQSGDPAQEALGEELALKLRYKMTQPLERKPITVNGLPGLQNPYSGEIEMSQVPEGARTRTVPNVPGLTPGTVAQEDPLGKVSVLQAPPAGYQGAPQQQTYTRGGPADPTAGANLVANEEKLRTEYNRQIQEYTAAREGYGKVVAAARTGTPAADIALIFGVMKTLDPTSTVREGEYATVQNSGTIDQTVSNIYNRLLTGEGSLTGQQRSQYADMARRQFEVYQKTADGLNERYGELARSYGFDPSRVTRTFEPIEPFKPAGTPPAAVEYPAALNRAHQNDVARGLYDPKAPLGSQKRPFLAADEAAVRAVDIPANKGKFVRLPNGDVAEID